MKKGSKELKSHPHLLLREHIDQVRLAISSILKRHPPWAVCRVTQKILDFVAFYHDIGKSTTFFQKYIDNPSQYVGNSADKAHSALSMFLALVIAKEQQWEGQDALAAAAVICGHHSRLPTFPKYRLGEVENVRYTIDRFASGSNVSVILKQLQSIDFAMLGSGLGIPFEKMGSFKDINRNSVTVIRDIQGYLHKKLIKENRNLDLGDAIAFRFKCQLIYSILLEADKALLAVSNPSIYFKHSSKKWDSEWVEKYIGKKDETDVNSMRRQIREEVKENISRKADSFLFNIIAPTGSGKTLLAATWALKLREATAPNFYSKVIIVLPFLSIIDQTVNDYKKLLGVGSIKPEGGWLLASHSLADRVYDSELPEGTNSFLVDTWRSDIIITTYDQFLYSLMDPRARYQMRFHNLCDALIIMDEVQSLPCKLWQPLSELFRQLAEMGKSKLLLMSATLPPFVSGTEPLLAEPKHIFAKCKRYCLRLRLDTPISLNELCDELEERLHDWVKKKKRVLLTFNTRKSARKIRDYIADWIRGNGQLGEIPLYFISADVTPKDRLGFIELIKKG
ncbi:MAG: CRISPR-associated endonuclease Cas3'', partial [Dethiobacteria bacterium]